MNKQIIKVLGLCVIAIALGLVGAYFTRGQQLVAGDIAGVTSDGQTVMAEVPDDVSTIKAGDVFGSSDEASFKDRAEGYLEAGGINGEGSHALVRSKDVSQTVYLTSSVTDLDKFVGMEVKVWGETFRGQAAGWLMDVGRVEVTTVAGVKPQ
jgi:hypothetical protein